MSRLAKALPDLVSAGLLFALWSEPGRFGAEWFRAAAFALIGWSAGYLAFISLFALGFDAWWMVAAFFWFCFAKVQAVWAGATPTERDRWHAMTSWALSVAAFLGAVGLTLTYDVPELGASAEVRAATGFDKGGGVWETEPHRALAGGVLYFAVMGLLRPPLAWAFASR